MRENDNITEWKKKSMFHQFLIDFVCLADRYIVHPSNTWSISLCLQLLTHPSMKSTILCTKHQWRNQRYAAKALMFLPFSVFITKSLYMYLFTWKSDTERQRSRKKSSFCWFTLQMVVMASVKPGEAALYPGLSKGSEPQVLGPSSAAFPCTLAGCCTRSGAAGK